MVVHTNTSYQLRLAHPCKINFHWCGAMAFGAWFPLEGQYFWGDMAGLWNLALYHSLELWDPICKSYPDYLLWSTTELSDSMVGRASSWERPLIRAWTQVLAGLVNAFVRPFLKANPPRGYLLPVVEVFFGWSIMKIYWDYLLGRM
jgi:hypothetical protein